MYSYNKSDVNKSLYQVQIRTAKTFEDPATDNQLMALVNDLTSFDVTVLDNTDDGSSVDTKNQIYDIDSTAANVPIDMDDKPVGLGGVAGDVLIFRAYNVDNTITITDEDEVATVLTHVDDVIVLVYTTKWVFAFKSNSGNTANQMTYFTEIGVLDEGPAITTEQGDTRPTHDGNQLSTKNLKFECNDLQVNEDNSDFYRALIAAGNVDIVFYCQEDPTDTIFLLDITLADFLDIKARSWNTIKLSSTKEVCASNISTYLSLYS